MRLCIHILLCEDDCIIRMGTARSIIFNCFRRPNVRCAPYETFGTKQLAEAAFEGMIDRRAVLLANHGLIAGANHIKWHLPLQKKLSFVHKFIIKRKALGNRSYCQKTRWRIWRRSLKGMGSSRRKSSLLWR